jgi:N-acyl-D-amino-acid deacylase
VWELLDLATQIPAGKKADGRWKQITIRQLLHHTGGWDRDQTFDPMFRSRVIAKELGVASPPGPRDIIRYMLGQSLDFDPGKCYAYSNFGYCVLGRVIEKITGSSYEKFVQRNVLAPIGITRMQLGHSLSDKRVDGEVRYYTSGEEMAESVFDDPVAKSSVPRAHAAGVSDAAARRTSEGPDAGARAGSARSGIGNPVGEPPTDAREPRALPEISWPYGGFCLEAMDAHGGWLASAVDLARFATSLDDPQRSPLLKPGTIRAMHAPPEAPVSRNDDGSLKDHYYCCGWLVRRIREGRATNYWHTGSLPGSSTLLVRRWDGLSWVVLFNRRSDDKNLPDSAIDPALHRAADAVKEWPTHDLFTQHFKGPP